MLTGNNNYEIVDPQAPDNTLQNHHMQLELADSTVPVYDVIPGEYCRHQMQHNTDNIVSANESLDPRRYKHQEGAAPETCRRTPMLKIYDTVTSSSDETNDMYSTLKYDFNTGDVPIQTQRQQKAAIAEATTTEPDEAQLYSSLKQNLQPTLGDQCDVVAYSNIPEMSSKHDSESTLYSTLDNSRQDLQEPESGALSQQENVSEYDVIKGKNIGNLDQGPPIYSTVNKAKNNLNYSLITAEDLAESMLEVCPQAELVSDEKRNTPASHKSPDHH